MSNYLTYFYVDVINCPYYKVGLTLPLIIEVASATIVLHDNSGMLNWKQQGCRFIRFYYIFEILTVMYMIATRATKTVCILLIKAFYGVLACIRLQVYESVLFGWMRTISAEQDSWYGVGGCVTSLHSWYPVVIILQNIRYRRPQIILNRP